MKRLKKILGWFILAALFCGLVIGISGFDIAEIGRTLLLILLAIFCSGLVVLVVYLITQE